jgi:hypothetical protein
MIEFPYWLAFAIGFGGVAVTVRLLRVLRFRRIRAQEENEIRLRIEAAKKGTEYVPDKKITSYYKMDWEAAAKARSIAQDIAAFLGIASFIMQLLQWRGII